MIRTARVLAVAAGFLIGAVLLLAQSPKASAPGALPPAGVAAPTELERALLENIQLKMMLLSDEERSIPERRQQLQQQYGSLVQQIEKEHPGSVWNPQTMTLVPAPKPAAQGAKK